MLNIVYIVSQSGQWFGKRLLPDSCGAEWAIKKAKLQDSIFQSEFKATTQNDKVPEVSSQTTLLNILKQYHLWPAIKRPTLSILFLHSCKFSPAQQRDKRSLCQEKQATIFLQRPHRPQTRPQSLATNHKLRVDFLGDGSNHPVNHKERGVSFIPASWLHLNASVGLPKHIWTI